MRYGRRYSSSAVQTLGRVPTAPPVSTVAVRPEVGVSTLALLLVTIFVFLSVSRAHIHFGFLVVMRVTLLVAGTAGFALALCMERWNPNELARHWIPKYLGIVFVIAVIGVPFSIYPGKSYNFILEGYSRTMMLTVMVWAVARTGSGAHYMAKVLLAAQITACAMALMLFKTDAAGRLSGAYTYDPNDLALIANMAVPMAVWVLLQSKNAFMRVGALSSLPLLLLVIVLTGSRGGFLGLATITGGLIAFALTRAPKRVRRAGIGTIVAAVVGFTFLPAEYVENLKTMLNPNEDYNTQSESGRLPVWKRGMGYARDNPIVGVGILNFTTAEGRLSELAQTRAIGQGLKWSAAHNSFVQITAELGFIAGFFFTLLLVRVTWLLLSWFRRARKSRAPPIAGDPENLLPAMLGLSFSGFMVSGFFLSFAYHDILYCYIGLAAGILMREVRLRRPAAATGGRSRR